MKAKSTCTVKGCGRPRASLRNQFCLAHHRRYKANLDAGVRNPAAGIGKTPLARRGRPKGKPRICTVKGCRGPHVAKGLCMKCYQAQRRAGGELL